MHNVLCLGAGVQSTAVLLMSCLGELPKIDMAVFADTGWEPKAIYEHLQYLIKVADTYGIPVHIVSNGHIKNNALIQMTSDNPPVKWKSMPLFALDKQTNKKGMLWRQCTSEYKILPIEKFLRREVLKLKPRQRAKSYPVIRQWFGISYDELLRMRRPSNKWSEYYYPLIDKRLTREDCVKWLESHNFPAASRSACIACPYKSNDEWRLLKDSSPSEWQEAVEFDYAMRNYKNMRSELFLHSDRIPLDQVDLSKVDKNSPIVSGLRDECQGMCGI